MSKFTKLMKMTPSRILLNSFLIIIAIGTALLMLPISAQNGRVDFLTALFTATSAVAVTGLSTVDVGTTFTKFGQIVILILIQLGGLGVMTFSSILMLMIGRRITYEEKKILQENLNREKVGGIIIFIKRIVFIVASIEIVGALAIFPVFYKTFKNIGVALYYSIFHSISAFCNAGFSILPNSLENYKGSILMNIAISLLIITGGIGFGVIDGIVNYIKHRHKNISLTSRLALVVSLFLLIFAGFFIYMTESTNFLTIGKMNFFEKIIAAFFQSTTARTAGFNTIPISDLRPATIYLFLFLMFIGASPGSTGGGIKTTTLGVIFFAVIAIIRNKKDVEISNRRISWHIINRAVAILFISLMYVFVITLAIMIREEREFIKIVFEVISAFGTVGLSMGVTSSLTTFSKVLIIITMFIGRLGPMTFALALGENLKISKHRYPRENIVVG